MVENFLKGVTKKMLIFINLYIVHFISDSYRLFIKTGQDYTFYTFKQM